MEREKVSLVAPLAMWAPLMFLLWLTSVLTGTWHYFVALSVIIYMVLVPLMMMRYFEKESIVQRLGMQSGKFLVCVLLAIASVLAFFTVTTREWAALLPLVLAPIPEEIFFRGYIMGRFAKRRMSITLKSAIGLVLSSLVFSISHVFRSYWTTNFLVLLLASLLVFGLTYWITGSILFSAVIHTVWNFLHVPLQHNLPPTLVFFWLVFMIIPSLLLFVRELPSLLKSHTFQPKLQR